MSVCGFVHMNAMLEFRLLRDAYPIWVLEIELRSPGRERAVHALNY